MKKIRTMSSTRMVSGAADTVTLAPPHVNERGLASVVTAALGSPHSRSTRDPSDGICCGRPAAMWTMLIRTIPGPAAVTVSTTGRPAT